MDGNGALADRRGDAFHRSVPNVADRENSGPAGFQEHRQAPQRPVLGRMPIVKKVGTGKDESRLITSQGVRQPFRTRLGADQYEQGHGRHGFGRTGL